MASDFEQLLPEEKLIEAKKYIVLRIKEEQIKQKTKNPNVAFNRTIGSSDPIDPFWQNRALDELINERYISLSETPWPVEIHLKEDSAIGFLYYQITVLEPFETLYRSIIRDTTSRSDNIIYVDFEKRKIEYNNQTHTYSRESNEVKILFHLLKAPSLCVPSKELCQLLNEPRADAEGASEKDRLRDIIKSIRNKFGKRLVETCSGGYLISLPIKVQD